ncbi:hypothetical protein [Stutzerimonas stutzeri]|uniref:hypothetical protein n=1 Tax=Stutzerimonas stutzeri TaxID=316 RepID=UPI0021096F20|nr:hypothetical protein [Stutzerimonas stutzeri]MCQ4257471.1 hypothetical protein [Stutzerimonas stutzeri]
MAKRIAYTGQPVLTLQEVARQCRVEVEDLQPELIEQIIIPGITAQCEARTGAAIREATYEEDWPEAYGSGHALDVGQVKEVQSVSRREADGSLTLLQVPRMLQHSCRESFLIFPTGRPSGRLVISYTAGADLTAYPGLKSWMLMHAATAFEFRETLLSGTILNELPSSFMDSLLAEITVPPRF